MEELESLVCQEFDGEDNFIEEVEDILDSNILECTYRDSFEILNNIYNKVRVRLENNLLIEFIYIVTNNANIYILYIDY